MPIDLSNFEEMRGNFPNFIVWLIVGWVIGGFLEEFTFRGYLITRLVKIFGEGALSMTLAILLTSLAFGLAHSYQGASGMISTGSFALFFGYIFIKSRYNIWIPIMAHGFANTVGLFLIYTDLDKVLNGLLV